MLLFGLQHYGGYQRHYDGVQGNFVVPGLPQRQFVQLGDINIGVLATMSRYDTESLCSDVLNHQGSVRFTQVKPFDPVVREVVEKYE